MSIEKPILVTERELITRIDRKLAHNGMALCRSPQATAAHGVGAERYDMIELATNHRVRQNVDLEGLAREIGALAEGEALKV